MTTAATRPKPHSRVAHKDRLPSAIQSERYVLGALIAFPDCAADVFSRLYGRDFVDPGHALIFDCLARQHASGGIDVQLATAELKSHPHFASESPAGYLLRLAQDVATRVHVPAEAAKIVEARRKRQLFGIGEYVRESSQNGVTAADILSTMLADALDMQREVHNAPLLIPVSSIESASIEWAWPGYLPRGMLTLVDGDPELGKSQITCAVAACWTTNKPFPFALRLTDQRPGNVLMVATEDNADSVIRPRLEVAGADLNRVFLWPEDSEPLVLPDGIERLRAAVLQHGIELLVIDPIGAHLAESINANRDADVRRALRPLVALAQETALTVLCVRHLNKDASKSPLYRGGGSVAFIAAARVAWAVGQDPHDPTRHVLAVLKTNIGQKPPSLFYRIEDCDGTPRVHWQGESTYTASDIIVAKHRSSEKLAKAEDIIVDLLAQGPRPEPEVRAACTAAGISEKTYRTARKAAGVRSTKAGMGNGWVLSLSEDGNEDGEDGK